jgi:hypothetical protein
MAQKHQEIGGSLAPEPHRPPMPHRASVNDHHHWKGSRTFGPNQPTLNLQAIRRHPSQALNLQPENFASRARVLRLSLVVRQRSPILLAGIRSQPNRQPADTSLSCSCQRT